ncbi:MAG: CDP-diacylglycerol--glycerol-3-phosphate 3-phosphatidyltransferase [Halobacteriovoraceae bacterium]|nr:CDP-diacylglycerol--glycerol-3-phosphate 3-phosphatidyltransferase [Halobacteriovoraceae bacterium]|tara:strand:+ start:497 stop:1135 length:639 start_codon:yes stop_codon:yes gene_type:complete
MSQKASIDDLQINNLPNRLTIFRILLIPVVLLLLTLGSSQVKFLSNYHATLSWAAGWIFALASITDFFDGYIARKRNIVTVFGSFLDPIADKFLTVSCLIMLQSLGRVPAVVVIVLVLREMYMTSLRLLATNEGLVVAVNNIGKWKTATQMIGIPLLMVNQPWLGIPLPLLGTLFIYLACILSLWSAIHYTINMIAKLKLKRKEHKEMSREN